MRVVSEEVWQEGITGTWYYEARIRGASRRVARLKKSFILGELPAIYGWFRQAGAGIVIYSATLMVDGQGNPSHDYLAEFIDDCLWLLGRLGGGPCGDLTLSKRR